MVSRKRSSRVVVFALALAAVLAMSMTSLAAAQTKCPGGKEPVAWEDNETTMVCPGGVRVKGASASGRTQLAQTGFELPLLLLAGGACMAGGLLLLRRPADR